MKRLCSLFLFVLLSISLTGCGKYNYKSGIDSLEKGEYQEAVEKLEKAVDDEYSTGDAYRGIGLAKWEMEDYEGAAEAFVKALENGAKKTGTIYNLLGACAMKTGDAEAAIEYYEEGLTKEEVTDEMAQEMRFNVIASYEALGDWESAKEKLAEYVEDYPDDGQAAKEAEFLETR